MSDYLQIKSKFAFTDKFKLDYAYKFKGLDTFVVSELEKTLPRVLANVVAQAQALVYSKPIKKRTGKLKKALDRYYLKRTGPKSIETGIYVEPSVAAHARTFINDDDGFGIDVKNKKWLTIPVHPSIKNKYNPRPRVTNYNNLKGFQASPDTYLWYKYIKGKGIPKNKRMEVFFVGKKHVTVPGKYATRTSEILEKVRDGINAKLSGLAIQAADKFFKVNNI